jgi:hypothetical protein
VAKGLAEQCWVNVLGHATSIGMTVSGRSGAQRLDQINCC